MSNKEFKPIEEDLIVFTQVTRTGINRFHSGNGISFKLSNKVKTGFMRRNKFVSLAGFWVYSDLSVLKNKGKDDKEVFIECTIPAGTYCREVNGNIIATGVLIFNRII